jgi:hypothetical protein
VLPPLCCLYNYAAYYDGMQASCCPAIFFETCKNTTENQTTLHLCGDIIFTYAADFSLH